jgi:flagellar motor protein MotB
MSMDAAQKAKSQLVAKGIDESIIELEGVGFSEPVKPFNFSTGVPENNRVEIKILGVDE